MPYYKQEGNSCGTTTLAEIMSYLGVPMTQADVDAGIRRMNIFTAPDDMIEFARDHGLEAEGYNHGTWEEVKSMIDAGYPVQAMVNGDDSVSVNGGSEPDFQRRWPALHCDYWLRNRSSHWRRVRHLPRSQSSELNSACRLQISRRCGATSLVASTTTLWPTALRVPTFLRAAMTALKARWVF